mgnify:CR=1 FL=1
MKTLTKPLVKTTIAIQSESLSKKREMNYFSFPKFKSNHRLILSIILSLSAFTLFPESPNDLASICNKYHSEKVCNVW